MKKQKNKNNLGMIFMIISIISSALLIVFSKSTLGKVNFEVEKRKRQIAIQKKTNESLTMAINELASLNKIREVAQQQGLRYNNSNIKRVSK